MGSHVTLSYFMYRSTFVLPSHVDTPSPLYPGLHEHLFEPTVFMHSAFTWQPWRCVSHSLISIQSGVRNNAKINIFQGLAGLGLLEFSSISIMHFFSSVPQAKSSLLFNTAALIFIC